MKKFLKFLYLSILLTSPICSCRSQKQSTVEYADTTSVAAVSSVVKVSQDDILSIISATRELDLSGIRIDFFAPDSAHPDARAAPKSLTIESAKAKESIEQSTKQTAAVEEQGNFALAAQSSAKKRQFSRSNNDVLRPADWVIYLSFIGAILIFGIVLFIYTKRK